MMAKYLATSLAMLKVVSAPRVISSCLPISTISMSLVGLLSRSTMLPASRAGWVPVFMATATSAWASAGASLVPSPVMATRRPPAWYSRMSLSLASGVACGQEVVHAGLGGDGRGGQRVVAGDHHGLDAHLAQLGEALLDAALDDVLEVDHAQRLGRCAPPPAACRPLGRSSSTVVCSSGGTWLPMLLDAASCIVSGAPLRIAVSIGQVHAAHARLGGEGDEMHAAGRSSARGLDCAAAQAVLLLGQHDDAAPFGRFVGQRGQLRRLGQLAPVRRRRPGRTPPPAGCPA